MKNKKIIKVGYRCVELINPNCSSGNNINIYDKNGLFLYNISELLKDYSERNNLEYFSDMYYDIQVIDNQNIYCIGNINHCIINLTSKKIIKIINNR